MLSPADYQINNINYGLKNYVIKRNGKRQEVIFDKIKKRLEKLSYNLNLNYIDPVYITSQVISGLYPGVSTEELDLLSADIAASMTNIHPDYNKLAARIIVSNLHKKTTELFSNVFAQLYINKIVDKKFYDIVCQYAEIFDSVIKYERDYDFSYIGIKTLEHSYLLRINDKIVERPQHMWMRVAIGIHGDNQTDIIETYQYLSKHYFIHATPTLFSATTPNAQLASCYLLTIKGDSIKDIFETISDCAAISKTAGGIGLNVHDIRAKGSPITNMCGTSNGIVPMLRVFNNVARYVDQGGGKRMGAFAVYIEPWHADIFDFLNLKKNHGIEESRARDLFYGLWIPDLFMKRVKNDGNWSLMCPQECPELSNLWGDEFERLYELYESLNKTRKTIPARQLWYAILEAQTETGTPYMLFKDACNMKSNQQHLGTIKGSNLCTEIIQYTSPTEISVCNLASISLKKFITDDFKFNFDSLKFIVKIITKNLNRIIDQNIYPVKEAETSNLRHRPIGIGVQGLADVFLILKLPYTSDEAKELNKQIFETIYYGALEASCELAKKDKPYATFNGSPASRGLLQFDLWKSKTNENFLWNWNDLKDKIIKYGLRNSLLIAPMPTASTAQILGNTESFEPLTSNIYTRRVLSGEFQIVNNYLIDDLIQLNLWTNEMRNLIIENRGSIQNINSIPQEIRNLYKTVWEMSSKDLIDMAADRGIFIDQSQSFNIYVTEPSYAKLSTIHFYAWQKGLKTGMYYLRTKSASNAIQFTVNKTKKIECTSCMA